MRKNPRECGHASLQRPHELYSVDRWNVFKDVMPHFSRGRSDMSVEETRVINIDLEDGVQLWHLKHDTE